MWGRKCREKRYLNNFRHFSRFTKSRNAYCKLDSCGQIQIRSSPFNGLYSNFCPSLGTHAYIGTWSLKSYLFWHTSSVYVPIYQCQSAYFVTVWEKLTITINSSIPSSNTHDWYKSTYKQQKHNYFGDLSQHTFGWSNSLIPMGDTSQHTFQNQENTTMSVIQVSILLDDAIQWYPWVIQVNILFKIKTTQLCRWFKSTYFWMKQFSDAHGWYKSTYFSKSIKHNYVDDSSQHTFG